MKNETKMTLGNVIDEMLIETEDLNGQQMQIIDMLCQINESKLLEFNTYYEVDGKTVDEFKDFVVENVDEIWHVFNACKTAGGDEIIDELVLSNSKERGGEKEDSRVIVNFKYVNGIPKFCYVRLMYDVEGKNGARKMIYNWNNCEKEPLCTFTLTEAKKHNKKSDFFIKLTLD